MWEKVFFGLISVFLVALIGVLRTALLKDVKRAEDKATTAEKIADELRRLLQEESKLTERRFHELKTTDIAQDLVQQELGKKLHNLDGSFHHQSGDLERRLMAYQSQVDHNTSLSEEARSMAIEGKAKAETLERMLAALLMRRIHRDTESEGFVGANEGAGLVLGLEGQTDPGEERRDDQRDEGSSKNLTS